MEILNGHILKQPENPSPLYSTVEPHIQTSHIQMLSLPKHQFISVHYMEFLAPLISHIQTLNMGGSHWVWICEVLLYIELHNTIVNCRSLAALQRVAKYLQKSCKLKDCKTVTWAIAWNMELVQTRWMCGWAYTAHSKLLLPHAMCTGKVITLGRCIKMYKSKVWIAPLGSTYLIKCW